MDKSEYQKIFSHNLIRYMSMYNKTQADLINDLGFNKSAVSTWVNGTRLPRMDKVNMLAKYFGILRSDLIEDKTNQPTESESNNMNDDDRKLIDAFHKLNSLGKEKAKEYITDLTEQAKYTVDDTTIEREA